MKTGANVLDELDQEEAKSVLGSIGYLKSRKKAWLVSLNFLSLREFGQGNGTAPQAASSMKFT
jgi:hypothetical protein